MSKKAQFYVFDAFFAALILFIGIGFLITEYTAVPQQGQTQALTFDVAQSLTANPLEDVFTNYTLNNYDILEPGYTPAQQIQMWWHNQSSCGWCMGNATALTASLIQTQDFERHGINISIRNETNQTTIYSNPTTREAEFLIVNQQLVITETIGPDIIEVRIWQ